LIVNITERLAEFINNIEYDQFPEDVINAAKESFLDFLAVSIVGARKGDLSKIIIPHLLKLEGKKESTRQKGKYYFRS